MGRATDIIKRNIEEMEAVWYEKFIRRFFRTVVYAMILVLGAYIINFGIQPLLINWGLWQPAWNLGPGGQEAWGQFGDFVGGVLNPLISVGALYWLMQSVHIQRTELTATRQALNESAQSQRDQVVESQKMARINALNVAVSAMSADINAKRDDIRFLIEQFREAKDGNPAFTDINGKLVNRADASSQLAQFRMELHELQRRQEANLAELNKLLGRHQA